MSSPHTGLLRKEYREHLKNWSCVSLTCAKTHDRFAPPVHKDALVAVAVNTAQFQKLEEQAFLF